MGRARERASRGGVAAASPVSSTSPATATRAEASPASATRARKRGRAGARGGDARGTGAGDDAVAAVGGGRGAARDGAGADADAGASSSGGSESDGDGDDEEEEDDDGDDGQRQRLLKRAGPPAKAPPLTEDQVAALDETQQRRVLARWNARLRGLKRRAKDIASQFPTSSIVLFCSKPLRVDGRKGRWAEEEFLAQGPIKRARREQGGELLSGPQLIRRSIADLMQLGMNPQQLAKYAFDEDAAVERYENVQAERARDTHTASLDELYEELKQLVAPQLHTRCAEVLAACTAIQRTGGLNEVRVIDLANESRRKREFERRPRTVTEALAIARELDQLATNARAPPPL